MDETHPLQVVARLKPAGHRSLSPSRGSGKLASPAVGRAGGDLDRKARCSTECFSGRLPRPPKCPGPLPWKERADCTWRDPGFYQTDSHPVVCISWNDAQEYVEWLCATIGAAYRLLSESEWEYAARAGTSTPFHFGNTIFTNEANYNGNFSYGSGAKGIFRERTTPVWAFPPNAFGLHDVHGNVSEWTQDRWGTYWGAEPDGSPWECPPSGSDWQPNAVSWHKMISDERLLRGGSWIEDPAALRSANRESCHPDHRASTIGFRVARKLTS